MLNRRSFMYSISIGFSKLCNTILFKVFYDHIKIDNNISLIIQRNAEVQK